MGKIQEHANTEGFTTKCKPLITFNNRKARLGFARKHLKQASKILESDSFNK